METENLEVQETQETQDAETLAKLSQEVEAKTKAADDLTIERDSLLEELNALKETHEKVLAELAETKKLNFTLGRQVGAAADAKTAEELTRDSFFEALKDVR